jgi:UDP-N-acetylmuramoyl-L-alanyl-D-glutamate--2,6-diaminopimelate ligase
VHLEQLLGGIEVLELRGDPQVEVRGLTHDSRDTRPGDCFACIVGATTDGHDHAKQAVAAGAVALLVERHLDLGPPEARVESVRAALGPAAARMHDVPSAALDCLGITGTNGKTTVTYLLEAIATAGGQRVGVVGTTGARIDGAPVEVARTTPEATELQALLARMRDAGVQVVAMEVSSHALAQHRVDGTRFAVACFTNLSHDHLDYHGSVEEYFDAKASLFDPSRAEIAVTNIDDPYGAEIARRSRALGLPVVTYGIDARDADVTAQAIATDGSVTEFTLVDRRSGDEASIELAMVGRFNVENALAAAGTAGLPWRAVVDGLRTAVVVPGRLEHVDAGQPFSVLVDYAHTPAALATALQAAREVAGSNRVIVVFGCGGDRDRAKRPLMGQAAASGADEIVLTNDNPRSEDPERIADEVLQGLQGLEQPLLVELDRRRAIRAALTHATSGDVVLVAGKGHERGQTTAGETVAFDDRLVVREELGALSWS